MSREGRPSGEAYVEMDTDDDIEKACKKDRNYMGHRYIEGNIFSVKFYCKVSTNKSFRTLNGYVCNVA